MNESQHKSKFIDEFRSNFVFVIIIEKLKEGMYPAVVSLGVSTALRLDVDVFPCIHTLK